MASSSSTGTGTALTSFWLKFFTEAGIPAGEATNYAISFSDHRMSQDMLMDLSKEILHDIGVTLMGDVIAILKHAKSVHAQVTSDEDGKVIKSRFYGIKAKNCFKLHVWGGISRRGPTRLAVFEGIMNAEFYTNTILDKAYLPSVKAMFPDGCRMWADNDPKHTSRLAAGYLQAARDKVLKGTPVASSSSESGSSTPPRRSTPASRTVNHYLASDPEARPMSEPAPAKGSSISQEMACRLGPSPAQAGANVTVKLGLAQKEEVPVPKSRRVFPEHEGKYKITMPSGTTAKTRKILEEQGLATATAKKFSVFDRLGGEGTGTLGTSPKVNPKVTITGLGKIVIGNKAGIQSAGVFDRLGGKKAIKRAATSTTDDPSEQCEAVEYAGVLKLGASPPKKQKIKTITIKKTIEQRLGPKQQVVRITGLKPPVAQRAAPKHPDSTSSGVLNMDVESTQLKTPLRNRLGKTVITSPATSTAITKPEVKKITPKTTLKARLGPQKSEATSTSTPLARPKKITLTTTKKGGVFERLGKQL